MKLQVLKEISNLLKLQLKYVERERENTWYSRQILTICYVARVMRTVQQMGRVISRMLVYTRFLFLRQGHLKNEKIIISELFDLKSYR